MRSTPSLASAVGERYPLESAKHLPCWQFATNVISESENQYLIKVELPEVKKEVVKIAVADGVITITAVVPDAPG